MTSGLQGLSAANLCNVQLTFPKIPARKDLLQGFSCECLEVRTAVSNPEPELVSEKNG